MKHKTKVKVRRRWNQTLRKINQLIFFWEENDQLNHVLFSRQQGSGDENGS